MTKQEEVVQPTSQQQYADIDIDTFIAILQAHREAQALNQHVAEQVRHEAKALNQPDEPTKQVRLKKRTKTFF
jgi:hypothetical protein